MVGTKFVSDSNILVITDKKVYLINKKDQSILYDYNSADICHYDCDDGKFSAVITTDHRDDNSYTLTVFDKNGKLMFSQALFGKVRGVSCSDRCVSVLFADKVETYSKKGKLVGNVTDVKHCDDIVLNGNYIYILTSDSVRKFAAYGMTEYAVQSEPVSVVE